MGEELHGEAGIHQRSHNLDRRELDIAAVVDSFFLDRELDRALAVAEVFIHLDFHVPLAGGQLRQIGFRVFAADDAGLPAAVVNAGKVLVIDRAGGGVLKTQPEIEAVVCGREPGVEPVDVEAHRGVRGGGSGQVDAFKVIPVSQLIGGALGEVRIAVDTVENYLSKVALKISDVQKLVPRVKTSGNGSRVTVDAVVHITVGRNIPEITDDIQNNISDQLKNELGIAEVGEIRVHVREVRPPQQTDL